MEKNAGFAEVSCIDTPSLHDLIRTKVVDDGYVIVNYTIFNPSDESETTNIIFTIGLYENHKHPEIVFTGFDSESAKLCVDEIIQSIKHGFAQSVDKRYFLSIDKTFSISRIDRALYSELIPPLDQFYNHESIDVSWMVMDENNMEEIRTSHQADHDEIDFLLLHNNTLRYIN